MVSFLPSLPFSAGFALLILGGSPRVRERLIEQPGQSHGHREGDKKEHLQGGRRHTRHRVFKSTVAVSDVTPSTAPITFEGDLYKGGKGRCVWQVFIEKFNLDTSLDQLIIPRGHMSHQAFLRDCPN